LKGASQVAIALLGREGTHRVQDGYAIHELTENDPAVSHLIKHADLVVSTPRYADLESLRKAVAPVQVVGRENIVLPDLRSSA
jgi:hypothetical protein